MTSIVASAPGKLVLLGEYAVLEGAPALVLAVDRRAHATLTPATSDSWEIVSPTLGMEARLQIDSDGATWQGAAPTSLAWVATLFGQFRQGAQLPPCRIELESDAFRVEHAGKPAKLGLGSSAALTVALLGALHALAQRPAPTLGECVRTHRAIQHGRGSGVDIAAAFSGGLLRYQLDGGATRTVPATLPEGLCWRCVYSGRPTSTSAMLATVSAWRERDPTAFAQCSHELATISSRGIDALAANDAAAFLACLHDYATSLARLGEAAGVDIASREHRAIAAIAADCGCVYKSCGAGGGDVGVTFAVEDTRLRDFSARVLSAGFSVIGLDADRRGLEVVSTA